MNKVKLMYASLMTSVLLALISTAAYAGPLDSWESFWAWIVCSFSGDGGPWNRDC